jgi:intracellular sulfur oxidation DsrE/DsrF family protein
MKTMMLSLTILLTSFLLSGKDNSQKVLFDLTSTDTKVHQSTMSMVKIMAANYPNSTFEVMVYGEALPFLMKGQSTVADDIALFEDNDNVIFTACEVSMELLFHIDESQLLDGVTTVENAIPAIVEKQETGWGYVKVGN